MPRVHQSAATGSPLLSRLIEAIQSAWTPERYLKVPPGRHLRQDKAGNILTLCPFHPDESPSFSFNVKKGTFNCFGCGEQGGLIKFAQLITRKSDRVDALLALADAWSVPLPAALHERAKRSQVGERSSKAPLQRPSPKAAGPMPGAGEQAPPEKEAGRPSARERWAQCAPLSENAAVLAYVRTRGLYSAEAEAEARATTGRRPDLAVCLRSFDGTVQDVQFRVIGEVAHDRRFYRCGCLPRDVGPLIFGQVRPQEELVATEGMTDFLAALSAFAIPPGSVIGIPGAQCAREAVEALVAHAPKNLRSVVLAFDGDPAGEAAVAEVTPLLTEAGYTVKRLRPPSPYKDLAEWAAALLQAGEDAPAAWRSALSSAPRRRPWLVSAPDFVAEAPRTVRFLIDRVLPVGALAVVQGSPGVGKTWLTLNFAFQVISQNKRVLLIEQEGSPSALANRLELVGAVSPLLSVAHAQPIRLDEPVWVERIAQKCQQDEVALLILDPLADLHSGDENSSQDMARLTGALKDIRRVAPSCSVLLLHHTVKGSWGAGEGRREHSRGSSVLVGAADVQMSLTQRGTCSGTDRPVRFRFELVKARDFQAPPPLDFILTVRGGRCEIEWRPVDPDGEEGNQAETEEELDERTLAKIPLDTSETTITVEELRGRLGTGKARTQEAVARLVAAGKVVRVPNRGLRRASPPHPVEEGS